MTRPSIRENLFLELHQISKHFSGVKALQKVDFALQRGEVHCIVGENGSGKSTLIKVIAGVHSPEPGGQIVINGAVQKNLTPARSTQMGIQVIYQDHSLFPNLSVAENIGIHQHLEPGRMRVNWNRIRQTAETAMSKIGVTLDPNRLVETLPVADRQIVAICRAIAADARLVIMDEPTASLTRQEVDALFRVVKDLQDKAITTVFVSHRLDEIMEIAERVTILRDGEKVGTYNGCDMNDRKLSFLMTGKDIDFHPVHPPHNSEKSILEVEHLSKRGNYSDISFALHKGELLGITGLLGSGRSELTLSLFGMNPPDSGQVRLNGQMVQFSSNWEAIAAGIGYLPEDRMTLGLVMGQSVSSNMTLAVLETLANRFHLIDPVKKRQFINQWITDLNLKMANPDAAVDSLSGGNQQRVVLAKWIATQPKVLILDSPTVGVDIAAKKGMYDIIHRLVLQGMSILLISDEVAEVYGNCHRILLMRKGRLMGEYLPSDISEIELGKKINAD